MFSVQFALTNDTTEFSVRGQYGDYIGKSKSRAHHTKQLYFAGLMHKLQDIQHLLLMFYNLTS
jgi:hypothetical protein